MPIQYIKRYQMVFHFAGKLRKTPFLPQGYVWVPWAPSVLKQHAKVKYLSFCNDMDGHLFPSFSSLEGCERLMGAISSRSGFLPETTWLIAYAGETGGPVEYCATIQGIQHNREAGGIQNVAVLPAYRRRGLGEALVWKALEGFRKSGVQKVSLEVTAENETAYQLYLRIGFGVLQTVYKETSIGQQLAQGWNLRVQ